MLYGIGNSDFKVFIFTHCLFVAEVSSLLTDVFHLLWTVIVALVAVMLVNSSLLFAASCYMSRCLSRSTYLSRYCWASRLSQIFLMPCTKIRVWTFDEILLILWHNFIMGLTYETDLNVLTCFFGGVTIIDDWRWPDPSRNKVLVKLLSVNFFISYFAQNVLTNSVFLMTRQNLL